MSLMKLVFKVCRMSAAAVAGYLIGSVMTADIVAKAANGRREKAVDLRAKGSGNPGGMNAMGELGKLYGVAVIVGDVAKGAVGAQAGRIIAGDNGAYAAATAAVVGHCFPATSGFRGGKGVATSLGSAVAVFPLYAPVDLAIALLGYVTTKRASISTFIASSTFVLLSFLWWWRKLPNGWGPRPTAGLPMFAVLTSAIIAYKFLTSPAEGSHIEDEVDERAADAGADAA